MSVGKVSDADFDKEVLNANGPVVVDFWAEWCGPCRLLTPTIEELASELGESAKVGKLNVDESPGTPGKYGVRAIPTILAFQGGQVVEQLQGARPKADFEDMIKKLIA